MTTYSIERLVHFQCEACQKWWSIGDAPLMRGYYCPWCGILQSPHVHKLTPIKPHSTEDASHDPDHRTGQLPDPR